MFFLKSSFIPSHKKNTRTKGKGRFLRERNGQKRQAGVVRLLDAGCPHLLIAVSNHSFVYDARTLLFLFAGIRCPHILVPNALIPSGVCTTPGGSFAGTRCKFECLRGYNLKGSAERVCQVDRTWSGTPTTCNSKWSNAGATLLNRYSEQTVWAHSYPTMCNCGLLRSNSVSFF